MANIISVACYKGGVAKTTTVASLAGILANESKVLMIDLDGQRNLTRSFVSEDLPETVLDAFKKKSRGELPIYTIRENLDLVPADSMLVNFDTDFISVVGCEMLLSKLIAKVKDNYDWIFIDTPAQLGKITINAVAAANYILIPMVSDKFSIDAVEDFMAFNDAVKEGLGSSAKVLGIVLTKYRERRLADRLMKESLKEQYGDLVCDTSIRENSAIVRAAFFLQDVTSYDKRSPGACDYASLLAELKNRISQNKK